MSNWELIYIYIYEIEILSKSMIELTIIYTIGWIIINMEINLGGVWSMIKGCGLMGHN